MSCPLGLKEGSVVGNWVLKKELGSGNYGTVFSATCSTFGSTEYAIKIAPFNKNKKKNQASFMINHEQTFYRIRFLAFQKDHDGLVSIVQDNKYTYMVMEKFPLSLSGYLRGCGDVLPPYLCYGIAASLIHIIQFCHSHYVLVNDIKVDNFMLRETPKGYQPVLIDLGAAEVKRCNQRIPSSGPRGTPLFTSINSDRQGLMFFSDDLSAISYVVCRILLGFLPWEKASSCEEILKTKLTTQLENCLTDYPEVLQFVSEFKEKNTDVIAYARWINLFETKAKALAPAGVDPLYLPKDLILSSPSSLPPKSSHKSSSPKTKTSPPPLSIPKPPLPPPVYFSEQMDEEIRKNPTPSPRENSQPQSKYRKRNDAKPIPSTVVKQRSKTLLRKAGEKKNRPMNYGLIELLSSDSSDDEPIIRVQPSRQCKRRYAH